VKKIIVAAVIILAIGGFVLFQKKQTPVDTTPSPNGVAAYKDGTYTGLAIDVQYGIVQVKANISGGKITDVQFVQIPSGAGHTNEVSSTAGPILKQEAITAQSANVNAVSGATQTSQGFIQSLQSALDQAKG